MAGVAKEIMDRNDLKGSDIAWLVPHQANKRIIDATAKLMQVSDDKVMMNISRYGNTTGGTIPLCLWDYEAQLKKGDNLILSCLWRRVYLGLYLFKMGLQPRKLRILWQLLLILKMG